MIPSAPFLVGKAVSSSFSVNAGVISETTEKIISMMQKNAGEFMVKVVFSVVSDSCFHTHPFIAIQSG